MLSISPISDVSYLTDSARSNAGMAYYADSADERPGVWWSQSGWIATDATAVEASHVKRIAEGRDPTTGDKIVAGKGDRKRAGFDFTFSAPKAFSGLWAVSEKDGRDFLDQIMEMAVRDTLAEIRERGLIEARRGKGGKRREPVAQFIAALYGHDTSRSGDDLPPSGWSGICFRFWPEGGLGWRGITSRKRSSASCARLRLFWRRAGRLRMHAVGSALPSRAIIGGARSMAA
ncbi:relaxase domain-containing protein [Acidiphilium sp.]|uniref:relaxase domain-containing protein n=1 Tax=Acidiphilium sp. TaxID=527 RepID=UPI00338EAF70